jgi:hypothetical protein
MSINLNNEVIAAAKYKERKFARLECPTVVLGLKKTAKERCKMQW